jgi:Mn-dependent DtxR family transcriptional regulator
MGDPIKPLEPARRAKLSAHQRSGITESAEDYLECIWNLMQQRGYATVSDVAETLDLIRPSVSIMIKRLGELGYLTRQPYRGFVLTAKGEKVARAMQVRHRLLTELFALLGLDPIRHQADIEGMEHHISDPTLAKFRQLIVHLRENPL